MKEVRKEQGGRKKRANVSLPSSFLGPDSFRWFLISSFHPSSIHSAHLHTFLDLVSALFRRTSFPISLIIMSTSAGNRADDPPLSPGSFKGSDLPPLVTDKSPHVLIAGAGLAGLFLGIFLERAGIPYEIFERSAQIKALGKWTYSDTNTHRTRTGCILRHITCILTHFPLALLGSVICLVIPFLQCQLWLSKSKVSQSRTTKSNLILPYRSLLYENRFRVQISSPHSNSWVSTKSSCRSPNQLSGTPSTRKTSRSLATQRRYHQHLRRMLQTHFYSTVVIVTVEEEEKDQNWHTLILPLFFQQCWLWTHLVCASWVVRPVAQADPSPQDPYVEKGPLLPTEPWGRNASL